jgi:hypothetical protein
MNLAKPILIALIALIVLILVLPFLQSQRVQARLENFDSQVPGGLLSQPPSPDVTAKPAPSQPEAQGEPAFLASAPGVVPGGAEISQGTTAFITNTPSPAVQQFANSVIVTTDQANSAYKDILQFLAQNPDKSAGFIKDLRAKFFADSCDFKDRIDFKGLAQAQNLVFNS